MKNLKRRWNINSNLQLALILIVFAINGSFAAWVAKPVTAFFHLSPENRGHGFSPLPGFDDFCQFIKLPCLLSALYLDNLNFSGILKKNF